MGPLLLLLLLLSPQLKAEYFFNITAQQWQWQDEPFTRGAEGSGESDEEDEEIVIEEDMKHHAAVQSAREQYISHHEKILKKLIRISSRRGLKYRSRVL